MMRSIFIAQDADGNQIPVKAPLWMKPAMAGLHRGHHCNVWLPQVLGVGYGFVEWAILGQFEIKLLISDRHWQRVLCDRTLSGIWVFGRRVLASAGCGCRGGIKLRIDRGQRVFPELASGVGVYTVVGMGAVAAAVLGAPISTTSDHFRDHGRLSAITRRDAGDRGIDRD